jgi:hypothetical protein
LPYTRVILLSILLLGCGYAAAAFHPDVYHIVRDHVLPPRTAFGAASNLGLMGGAFGMFLSLGLAPSAFLHSEAGRTWVQSVGRTNVVVLFRLEMLGLSAFMLLVTVVIAGQAFIER